MLFAVLRGVTWLKLEAECAWHWLCFAVALMLAFDSFHANHVTHRFLMIWLHTSFWEHAVRGLSRLLCALSVISCHCWINPFLGDSVFNCLVLILIQAPESIYFCQNANAAVGFQTDCVVVLIHICQGLNWRYPPCSPPQTCRPNSHKQEWRMRSFHAPA